MIGQASVLAFQWHIDISLCNHTIKPITFTLRFTSPMTEEGTCNKDIFYIFYWTNEISMTPDPASCMNYGKEGGSELIRKQQHGVP